MGSLSTPLGKLPVLAARPITLTPGMLIKALPKLPEVAALVLRRSASINLKCPLVFDSATVF